MNLERAAELIRRWSEKLACTAPEAFDAKVWALAQELKYIADNGDGPGHRKRPFVAWCEEHQSGGAYASCLTCECQVFSAALATIDHMVDPDAEPGPDGIGMVSSYDIDHDRMRVVERVRALKERASSGKDVKP